MRADAEGVARGAEVLAAGGVVVYPTETVYGLGCDPHNPAAIERIFDIKGRPSAMPLLLIAGTVEHTQFIAGTFSPAATQCAQRYWPGPLSLLLPPGMPLPARLLGETGKVCVRLTSHPVAQGLCQAFGGCVTSTSANRTGMAPPVDAHQLDLEGVDLVIDGGPLPPGPVSTVYDPDERVIVREGAVPRSVLEMLPEG